MLSENLKRKREEKGYSQEKLAQLCGITRNTISFIEVERVTEPNIKTLKLLANALDTTVQELIK